MRIRDSEALKERENDSIKRTMWSDQLTEIKRINYNKEQIDYFLNKVETRASVGL
jgi:hypothetical protein